MNKQELVQSIAEYSNSSCPALDKSGLGTDVTKFGNIRSADQEQRVVIDARPSCCVRRHMDNIPINFTTYRGADVK